MWSEIQGSDFNPLCSIVADISHLTTSEAKEQVLANLANFAYDPNNMEYLKELQVTDLFLDMLTEENENFVEFGMGEYHTNKSIIISVSQ